MSKKIIIFALALSVLVSAHPAYAQKPGSVYRIGLLGQGPSSAYVARFKAFRQELRTRGYVEGQSIRYEYRYAGGKLGRLPSLAAELVRLKVDVLVSTSTPTTRAAMNASRTIPIVMNAASPVATGLVASLVARAGTSRG